MPTLIPDWRRSWEYPSVSMPAVALAIEAALSVDPHCLDFLPGTWPHLIATLALIYGKYDRLTTHPPKDPS